jgi:hypothetical protein
VLSGTSYTTDSQAFKDGVGGTIATTDPSGTTGTTGVLGAAGGSGYFPGAIAAILVFSQAHSTEQRQQIERWLGDQFGITVA